MQGEVEGAEAAVETAAGAHAVEKLVLPEGDGDGDIEGHGELHAVSDEAETGDFAEVSAHVLQGVH